MSDLFYPKVTSFFKRPLPDTCISFESTEGKTMFKEAMVEGTMECYFAIAGQMRTQPEPAYCGLTSLTIALNALAIDPHQQWKGVWRWWDESMLSCCAPLEVIQEKGISLSVFNCLARCNGAKVKTFSGDEVSFETFEKDIETVSQSQDAIMVLNYHRGTLGQTGTGHFSPVAGYHKGKKRALILETAAFKYPQHWASINDLYLSMTKIDPDTGFPRGYSIIQSGGNVNTYCRLTSKKSVLLIQKEIRGARDFLLQHKPADADDFLIKAFQYLFSNSLNNPTSIIKQFAILKTELDLSEEYKSQLEALKREVEMTALFQKLKSFETPVEDSNYQLMTLIFISIATALLDERDGWFQPNFLQVFEYPPEFKALAQEVMFLRENLQHFGKQKCNGCCKNKKN